MARSRPWTQKSRLPQEANRGGIIMEEEITMTAASTLPMWLNVFIGIVAAVGGWEAIKYLLSLRANRRKDKAQAKQEENTAAAQDVDIRKAEYELMKQFIDQYKERNSELQSEIKDYKEDKAEDRKLKAELRKELNEVKMAQVEQERKIRGLQQAFTESETRRRSAERLYCSVESCPKRVPPLGSYNTGDIPIPRLPNGQFAKRKQA